MTLTSVESVSKYLQTKSIPFSSVTELTNGTGNFVFRITRLDGASFIFKHAEPYVKANSAIPFPVARMQFEANALSTIPSVLPLSRTLSIQPAALHIHDSVEHVLRQSDGGSRTLKEAYMDPAIDIPQVGARLGKWLAQLHAGTKSTDIGDNVPAKNIYRYCYKNVATSLEKFGLDPDLGSIINDKYGSLLNTDNECICHGDFWTGNIVISDDTKAGDTPSLTVVDWELTRRGCGATDVGQFAAEAWLLDRFRPENRGLKTAFVKAYREETRPSKEFLKRAAVHFGCHLGYWPSQVSWGDHDQTLEVIEIGEGTMRRADAGDWDWLECSELLLPDG
ncbi:MAG: hypothetical protein MMC23_000063 [Stictis urceolatum]|nr:hypothetical protein [Stictis urceolata]